MTAARKRPPRPGEGAPLRSTSPSTPLALRLTAEERLQVTSAAEYAGVTVSEWIRRRLFAEDDDGARAIATIIENGVASDIRVLSVRQPWASLIANGRKSVELRSWPTKYRGPVLIVSGATPWRGDHGYDMGPLGQTICLVDLVDVRTIRADDVCDACLTPPDGYDFAWVLKNPRSVRATPIKGKLGLYRATATLLRESGLG